MERLNRQEEFKFVAPNVEVSLLLAELCYRAHNASYLEGQTFETSHAKRILSRPAMAAWLKQFEAKSVVPVEWKKDLA